MVQNQIIKGVGKGLKKIVEETVEKLGDESQKILESTITGKELLGLEGGINSDEIAQQKHEDDFKKQEEIRKIKLEMGLGRDVEKEIEEIRKEKEREEEEKEKYFEKEKQQKEIEAQQIAESNNELMMESTNPSKQKKSRGSAFGHKKKQQPDQSQMSATSEFKGKVN
ncbi:MAG: hypothetical protein PHX34_01945 [Candidatus Shapirobacteria bacterium]|nr:hypothetical protein [Candidatus Shapirobacteria bacterium]